MLLLMLIFKEMELLFQSGSVNIPEALNYSAEDFYEILLRRNEKVDNEDTPKVPDGDSSENAEDQRNDENGKI